MNKIMAFVAVFSLMLVGNIFAENGHGDHQHGNTAAPQEHANSTAQESKAVNVGNTICPVSGEKIGEMGEIVTAEYNGKIYNLCCRMCKKDFLKNPGKYSKIAEDEVKASGTDKGAVDASKEHSHKEQHNDSR